MTKIEFFKATSKGKLENLEPSASSLHYRRSVLVKDDFTKTIWVFHGSSVSKKTSGHADKLANEMAEENNYEIVTTDHEDATEIISEVLENLKIKPEGKQNKKKKPVKKSKGKKQAKEVTKIPTLRKPVSSIPKTPLMGSTPDPESRPKGDLDGSGPEIAEFQIAYYEQPMSSTSFTSAKTGDSIQPDLMKQALEIISQYIKEVDEIINKKPTKQVASSHLDNLSKKILSLVYD